MMPALVVEVRASGVTRSMETAIRALDHHVGRAVVAGSVLIADAARELAGHRTQVRTGGYIASIIPGRVRGTFSRNTLQVIVAAGGARIYYAKFLEHGTKPHVIEAKKNRPRGSLRWVGSGDNFVFRRRVHHPGTKPLHIMRDAARMAGPQLGRLVADAAAQAFRSVGL